MLELLTSGLNPFSFIKNNWRIVLFIVFALAIAISGMWFYSHYTGLNTTIENQKKTISEKVFEIQHLEKEQKRLIAVANQQALENDRLAKSREIDSKIVAELSNEIAEYKKKTTQQKTKLVAKIEKIKNSSNIPEDEKPKAISFELASDIWLGYCDITIPSPSECPDPKLEIKPSTNLQTITEFKNDTSTSNADFKNRSTDDNGNLELRSDRMLDTKDENGSGLSERNQGTSGSAVLDASMRSVDAPAGSSELQPNVARQTD